VGRALGLSYAHARESVEVDVKEALMGRDQLPAAGLDPGAAALAGRRPARMPVPRGLAPTEFEEGRPLRMDEGDPAVQDDGEPVLGGLKADHVGLLIERPAGARSSRYTPACQQARAIARRFLVVIAVRFL